VAQKVFITARLPALREAGLLAAARGHVARARTLLDEALVFAVKCEARFEEAQTRQAWGRVGLALGWSGAAQQLEAGRHALRQLGATWLLEGEPVQPDPVERTLHWGRQLAAHPEQAPEALAELAAEGPQVEHFLRSVAGAAQANAERARLQEEARRALRRQDTELRALFAAAGVGLVVTDEEGTVVEANETFRQWVGPQWQGRARAGEWLLETACGRRLLSRWTAGGPRVYTVTLVEDLERVTAAQDASWRAREGRLERFRGALERHQPERLSALAAPFELNLNALWNRAGVPVEVSNGLPEQLPPLTGRTLRRLLQEALANVQRHSQAKGVKVELTSEPFWLTALVRDDGIGFDPGEPTSRLGLRGMLWRARFAGGECQVDSAPGRGTTVKIRLPL
jgi:PAS domain-containing protein